MTTRDLEDFFTVWQFIEDTDNSVLIRACAKIAKKFEFDIEELPMNLYYKVKEEIIIQDREEIKDLSF